MFTNAGQFQVIIGNDVSTFYNDFVAVSGVEGFPKNKGKAAKQNLHPVQRAIAVLAEIFTPLIPAIIVGGLILGFRNVLEGIQFESLGGTMVEHSQFWNGVNAFLWLPGEAIFPFSSSRYHLEYCEKMGTTQILGIVLGITLVSPQLLNAYSVAFHSRSRYSILGFWFCSSPNDWLSSTSYSSYAGGVYVSVSRDFLPQIYPSVDLNDLCSIVFIVTNCFSCSRYFWVLSAGQSGAGFQLS